MDTKSILTLGFSITALVLASGCSAGAVTTAGTGTNGGGSQNGSGSNVVGSSSSANGASCPSGEKVVASTDGYVSSMTVAGSYVYLEQSGITNGGGVANGSFVRVPVGGGDVETLDEDGASVFAANDAGIVAWTHQTNGGTLVGVQLLDTSGQHTITLPMGAQYVSSLAVDAAGNVFVLVSASTGGNDVYRYSVVRQTFDLLHHNLAGLQGFYKDGTGVSWLGPGQDGTPALFHEDVLGGAPVEGPSLPDANQIAGIDAKAVYQTQGNSIRATDRVSGQQTVALDVTSFIGAGTYMNAVTLDDANFYFVTTSGGGSSATIYRASKAAGDPQSFATADQIGNLALGSCSIAYLTGANTGSFSVVTRPK